LNKFTGTLVIVVLVCLGSPSFQALADTIKTVNGNEVHGLIASGFPESITIEAVNGTLTVQRANIVKVTFGQTDSIETKDGSVSVGTITTDLSGNLVVEAGELTHLLLWENIASVEFGEVDDNSGPFRVDLPFHVSGGAAYTPNLGWQAMAGVGLGRLQAELQFMPYNYKEKGTLGNFDINGVFMPIMLKAFYEIGPARAYAGAGYLGYRGNFLLLDLYGRTSLGIVYGTGFKASFGLEYTLPRTAMTIIGGVSYFDIDNLVITSQNIFKISDLEFRELFVDLGLRIDFSF